MFVLVAVPVPVPVPVLVPVPVAVAVAVSVLVGVGGALGSVYPGGAPDGVYGLHGPLVYHPHVPFT